MARNTHVRRAWERFFDPGTFVPFLPGSLALAIVGSGAFEWLKLVLAAEGRITGRSTWARRPSRCSRCARSWTRWKPCSC